MRCQLIEGALCSGDLLYFGHHRIAESGDPFSRQFDSGELSCQIDQIAISTGPTGR